MDAATLRHAHAPPAPERKHRPGNEAPHTTEECDRELRRLLAETRGVGRHAAFNVWLDERLRACPAATS